MNLKNVVLAGVYCENDSGTIGNTLPINHFHMVFRRLAYPKELRQPTASGTNGGGGRFNHDDSDAASEPIFYYALAKLLGFYGSFKFLFVS